jgi:hypothetical protein
MKLKGIFSIVAALAGLSFYKTNLEPKQDLRRIYPKLG